MVPRATSSHKHSTLWAFQALASPSLSSVQGGTALFPFHLTHPEGSLPSGHAATKIIFQHQIFLKTTLRHRCRGCALWGDVSPTQRSPFSPGQHRAQASTAPAPRVPRALAPPQSQLESETAARISISDWQTKRISTCTSPFSG